MPLPFSPRGPRRLALAAAAAAVALLPLRSAGAQILRVQGPGEPLAWGSLGIGFLQYGSYVRDGATQTVWDFGNGLQYRGALEKGIGRESSIGIAATYSRLPLTLYSTSTTAVPSVGGTPIPSFANCRDGCDAHATVSSLAATFHAGGGPGIHQVIEGSVGAVRYANFTRDGASGSTTFPTNTDASLTVGYGVGYTMNRTVRFSLVQDASAILHERTGLRGGERALAQVYTTRLSVRVGGGSRRPGV